MLFVPLDFVAHIFSIFRDTDFPCSWTRDGIRGKLF